MLNRHDGSNEARTRASFYGVLVLATLMTTVVHEAAHWAMGSALGHEMAMSFNEARVASGAGASVRDVMLITAAGPAITLLQAVIAYALIRSRGLRLAYPFLFAAWFMRFAAGVVSLAHPNDEARLSIELIGGMWWLPAVVVLGLLALLWSAARRMGFGWRTNVACYLICSVLTAAIVFGDRVL